MSDYKNPEFLQNKELFYETLKQLAPDLEKKCREINDPKNHVNCHGASLFLLGLRNQAGSVSTMSEMPNIVASMKEVTTPLKGVLVCYEATNGAGQVYIPHPGVLVSDSNNNFFVLHKPSHEEELRIDTINKAFANQKLTQGASELEFYSK